MTIFLKNVNIETILVSLMYILGFLICVIKLQCKSLEITNSKLDLAIEFSGGNIMSLLTLCVTMVQVGYSSWVCVVCRFSNLPFVK